MFGQVHYSIIREMAEAINGAHWPWRCAAFTATEVFTVKKAKCDHFWEIDFPVTNWDRPNWKCMNCGARRKAKIPILNLDEAVNTAQQAQPATVKAKR